MTTQYRWTHAVATGIACGAVSYQTGVIWEMLSVVSTTTKMGVPLATVSAALLPVLAEAAWRAGERAKALLMALPVVVLMAYVLPSGVSRLGEAQEARHSQASVSEADQARIRADLARADRLVAQAEAWTATECASGAGSKCKGQQFILAQRQAYQRELRLTVASFAPIAKPWLPSWQPALLPIGLEIAILASLFYGMGPLTHARNLPPPAAVQSIPAEKLARIQLQAAPLQITRADVDALKMSGMKQHEIAARFGVNQGRISELMSGKRNAIAA